MSTIKIKSGYKRRNTILFRFSVFFLLISLVIINDSAAQYFGRNKPGYRKFQFNIVQTPNFEIYHYLTNDSLLNVISQWSEKWYQAHQKVFKDTFDIQNPIILYNDHADFQQTNTVEGLIGTGTGGVTESLKNRVVMPVASTLAQTDHVLGHELVHAFQYHFILDKMKYKEYSLRNIPLWMVEGMAEYLSKGSFDPHTSIVMRDALLNDDFPTTKKLSTDSEYFPYTYGQSFWAMVCKTWGDSVMIPLFEKTALYGFDKAADTVLGFNEKVLSGMWKSATELHFSQFLKSDSDNVTGKRLVSGKNAGRINISPSVSPDGKYFAFFSEKDIFTLDLFLADAATGKIIKKLSSVVKNNEIDDFNFIESSGTWSPDSKEFAFVVFTKGTNKLAVLNIDKSRITREFEIPGVKSFSNPAWSPDGKRIVISGQVDGINDLYLYTFEGDRVVKLTDDFTSDLHPSWSSDGNYIVFSQEKLNETSDERKYSFNIAVLNLGNNTIKVLDVFKGAHNLNPFFSGDNNSIFFLSDADGFRNLFMYDLKSENIYRLTEYMTGITGITPFSPALSVSGNGNLIAYNYYINNSYNIYLADKDQFIKEEFTNRINYEASILPPLKSVAPNTIDSTLYRAPLLSNLPADSIIELPYRPKFELDYISNNASVGVATGLYRNNLGGSINMIFSDIVGNNIIQSSVSLNGEIYDFGGQAAYINQKDKFKWGGAVSHIPYRTGNMFITPDSLYYKEEYVPVDKLSIDYLRIFEDNISIFGYYPLSQTRRLEATMSSSWYYYRNERYNYYYLINGPSVGGNREKLDVPDGSNYQQVSLAYVEDNSFFGMTSPMQGHRQRLQIEKYFGDTDLFTTLIDYRKYFYIRPVSLAFRFYNYGIYGRGGVNNQLPQLYLGNPWLIRGYENNADKSLEYSYDISGLTGSRIALANAEIRFPLSGPERLALFKSKWVFADLNVFFDSGIAWNRESKIRFNNEVSAVTEDTIKTPVFSTGVSLRVNVFGYLVVEPYWAFPLSNGGFKNGNFGLNFIPGW